jgi:hypothetical protein
MDEKAIVLYLHMRGMWLDAIHEDLLREKFLPKNDGSPSQPVIVEPGPVDQEISIALPDGPFSSVRELSQLTCLPRSTVHSHLTDSLRFRIQHLRWIPDLANAEEKRIRVNMAGEL